MKQDCAQEIAMITVAVRGAISMFDFEGMQILHTLRKCGEWQAYTAFDNIGAALYCIKEQVESITEPEEDKKP